MPRAFTSKRGLRAKSVTRFTRSPRRRKYCASCHANVTHKSLAAREKHLAELQCAACHSIVSGSEVEIDVTLPPGTNGEEGELRQER